MRFVLIAVLLFGSSAYAKVTSQGTQHSSHSGRSARAHRGGAKHAKKVKASTHRRRVAKKAHHR